MKHMRHEVIDGSEHVVQFYEHDADLSAAVANHLAPAIGSGGAAVAIATPEHLEMFREELAQLGVAVESACDEGTLVLLDAAITLSAFMPDGKIDESVFFRVIGGVLDSASQGRAPLNVFGEMVALLWDEDRVLEAIELEDLWNTLGRRRPFRLMCGYAGESLARVGSLEDVEEICRLHSSVLPQGPNGAAVNRAEPIRLDGEFPARLDSPFQARQLLERALEECDHGDQLRLDAHLVLSELVTNAVVHAGTPVSVAICAEPSSIHLVVGDQSTARPSADQRGPGTGLGMGLKVVASVAADWGIRDTPDGKAVWAQLRG